MQSKPKLLIINPNQFGYSAGYHYYAKYLSGTFDIDFVCFDKGFPKIREEKIKIYYLNWSEKRIKRLLKFILFSIKMTYKNKYDSLFTVYFNFVQLIGLIGRAKIKVLDIRTGSLDDSRIKRFMYNKTVYLSTFFFNRITVLSDSLAKLLNLPNKKTKILPLGAEIIVPDKKVYNKMYLIYIGTFYKRNIEKTIEGFEQFYFEKKNTIPIKYYIIGFGSIEEEKTISETIKKYKLNNVIKFLGRKNHNELYSYLKEATIGISFVPQTSYYDVQPPTKIFEYALSGLITISTDTYEARKLITKENGVICQDNAQSFKEKLDEIYENLDYYSSDKIRKSLINNEWKTIVKKILVPVLKNSE